MVASTFTPWSALIGGCLIGAASSLSLAFNGKVPGISGVVARILRRAANDTWWRVCFVIGLLGGGAGYVRWSAQPVSYDPSAGPLVTAVAGLLIGFGARVGGGCTSGHGICGIGRGSATSIVATVVFMATGMLTVWVSRQLSGAA
jgi:uncharacterized membrane protein YedE/YeeE